MRFSPLERFNPRQSAGSLGQFPVGGEFALMELLPLLDQPGCGRIGIAIETPTLAQPWHLTSPTQRTMAITPPG